MRRAERRGKTNQLLIAIVPPIVFLAGLMIYNAYKFVMPSAMTVDKTRVVEALEVIGRLSPLTSNGLPIPQPQSIRAGGSSVLVVTRPAQDGDYILVTGMVSASFLQDKIGLDKMLHIKLERSNITVESGGESVEAVVLVPRTETEPLTVDDPTTDPDDPAIAKLYKEPKFVTAPAGSISGRTFTSDNGMTVDCQAAFGTSGTLGMPAAQLHFTLDPDSSAWIQMSHNYRIQHTAIGTEDLEIGLLIPREAPGKESFDVKILGESVATVRRR